MVRASRLTLPGHGTNNDSFARLESDAVQLCWVNDCSEPHADGAVLTAHQDCWGVARNLHPSVTSLYSVAQGRRQILPLQHSTRPDARLALDRVNGKTPLGEIIRAVTRKLPIELQDEISKSLRGHLVACLSLASLAAPHGDEKPTSNTPSWESVDCHDGGERLNITTSWILGLEYVSKIGIDDREGVSAAGMRGIRFALDTFGIRGLRVMYKDQSLSPWLGDHRFAWYGEAYGDDLSQLRVIRDVSIFRPPVLTVPV